MTHAIDLKHKQSNGIKQFQEFIFIGTSSAKSSADPLEQLHRITNSNLLSRASTGNSLMITQIFTIKSVTRQLQNLQLKPGKKVQLVSRTSNGSVVVSLDGKLIGIGANIAQKIIVTLASQER